MKLSNKTLQKLIKGACYFETKNGYLYSYRYSRAQIEHMSKEGYDRYWLGRALICGPQRIEFKTDATEVFFDYETSESHINANTVDLYVNNELSDVYHIDEVLKGRITFYLPEGQKKIAIYLPCESILRIKNFNINGGYKSIKSNGKKVLIIGDSITQGAGPSIASVAYANGLARGLGYNILAQGIGGYRYEPDDVMAVEGFTPDKIIVALGTNWYNSKEYDYEAAVRGFYKNLVATFKDTPVLCITPLWRGNVEDMPRFMWCIAAIKNECAKYENIKVIDGFTLVPHVNECFSDKVHPNSYGSLLLTNNLIDAIKKLKF